MPSAASSLATALMNGCPIPAPAPCANTNSARAAGARCHRPETRLEPSIVSVTAWGTAPCTALVCPADGSLSRALLFHRVGMGIVILASRFGGCLRLLERGLLAWTHLGTALDLLLTARGFHELLLGLVEFGGCLGVSLAVIRG